MATNSSLISMVFKYFFEHKKKEKKTLSFFLNRQFVERRTVNYQYKEMFIQCHPWLTSKMII